MTLPQRINAALTTGAQRIDDIREALNDIPPSSVDAVLSRMVKRGQLTKPERGMYGLAYQDAN